jgi:hypothetical protein
MPLDWVDPSDLAAPSMITGGPTLAIVVAGVALGVLVTGGFGWRATLLGVAGARGALALDILPGYPRLPPTERMIWPRALTYEVPTLVLCWPGCCELLIVKEGANLRGVDHSRCIP